MKKLALFCIAAAASLAALAKDVVIDVRTRQEFQTGHIEGAVHIDHSVIGAEISKANASKDDHLILYCRSGRRSAVAQDALKKLGFKNVENYGSLEEAQQRLSKPAAKP